MTQFNIYFFIITVNLHGSHLHEPHLGVNVTRYDPGILKLNPNEFPGPPWFVLISAISLSKDFVVTVHVYDTLQVVGLQAKTGAVML